MCHHIIKSNLTKFIEDTNNHVKFYFIETCVGSGAFGEVYIADAFGITSFDPRYKISMKHKAFISRLSFRKSLLVRNDSLTSSKSSKIGKGKDSMATVAVKRLKGN